MMRMVKTSLQLGFLRPFLIGGAAIVSLFVLAACGVTSPETIAEAPSPAATSSQEAAEAPVQSEPAGTLPPPVIVEVTSSPIPVTNTPAPTSTPDVTATLELTAVPPTDTPPPPPPANTPQPPPPTAPPATETSIPPTAPPPLGANGLVASHFALQERSNFSAGQSVWFEFVVSNSTGGEVPYNALGVMPKKDGVDRLEWYQHSYGGPNSTIKPGGLEWEDRIKLPEPGNYTLRLVMCFEGYDNCRQGGGTWVSMSQEIPVQIK